MVICLIALIVFSIMAIWSTKYKHLAREALTCVKNMLLFQPCKTNLDQRIKSKVAIKLMKIPPLAKFFYKNFKVLSWIFTISFFASMIYSAYGIYNLAVYGSCQSGSVCVINQGANQIVGILTCYEAYIVYGIIAILLIALLLIKYLNIEFKIER